MDWVVGTYTDVIPEVLGLKNIRVEQDVGLFLLEDHFYLPQLEEKKKVKKEKEKKKKKKRKRRRRKEERQGERE